MSSLVGPARGLNRPTEIIGAALPIYSALLVLTGMSYWSSGLSPELAVFSLSVLLTAYLGFECYRVHALWPDRWLLNPIIGASLFTFAIPFALSNFVFLAPVNYLDDFGFPGEISEAMAKVLMLAILGAVAMWMGFWGTTQGTGQSNSNQRSLGNVRRWFSDTYELRIGVVIAFVAIGFIGRYTAISLNVFGYASDYGSLIEYANVREYLATADYVSRLSLLALALSYFSGHASNKRTPFLGGLLLSVFIYELLIGYLSGFKSQVVMPVIVVAAAYYWQRRTLPIALFPTLLALLFSAYVIIEPFRVLRYEDTAFRGTTVAALAEAVIDPGATSTGESSPLVPTIVAYGTRSNGTYVASLAIGFADETPLLPEGAPNFLGDVFLAPIHALVPRLIWESKPLGDLGNWFFQTVFGGTGVSNSVAMTPIGYLYFTAGVSGVLLGFLIFGALIRLLFQKCSRLGSGGAVTLLGLAPLLVNLDSSINGTIVSLIRTFLLLFVFQRLVFK